MSERQVLIADDEPRMRKLVADFLRKVGYGVVEAGDGQEAFNIFKKNPSLDIVILDVMMPEMDGWVVCREIRKTSQVPIIMLTARGQESDELFGFELGADEYITKPFSPNVLVARVNALLRRSGKGSKQVLHFNALEIDTSSHQVTLDGQELDLSPTEYDLLYYLVENKGRALRREQILNAVWGYDYFGDVRTVDTHVTRLRGKLGEKSDFIQTVRGVGYRFEVKA